MCRILIQHRQDRHKHLVCDLNLIPLITLYLYRSIGRWLFVHNSLGILLAKASIEINFDVGKLGELDFDLAFGIEAKWCLL